jgi:phage gp29-like protein
VAAQGARADRSAAPVADGGAKCCGIALDPLCRSIDEALQRRRQRKIREQIARELAELDAARKMTDLTRER